MESTARPLLEIQHGIAAAVELKKRRAGGTEANPFAKYRDDPARFATEVLRYYLWSKQREICDALVKHDRVAVKSAHETGKSFVVGGVIVPWWIAVHTPGEAMVVTIAPTFPQVRTIIWREVNRSHARGSLPGYTNQTEWIIGREVVAFGRKPDDNDPAAFQGIHALNLLVLLDEACGVYSSIWTAAETLVANEGGKILAIGNPDDPNTEFGAVCKPGSGYHVITISAFDTPSFTGEDVPVDLKRRLVSTAWVEQRRRRWGEASPLYISKILGEFPEVSEDSLISPKDVAAAVSRELPAEGPSELGVDVARFGRNETVCYHRRGPVARLKFAFNKRDLMYTTGMVVQAIVDTGATVVKVDEPGVGGGVVDRLNELARSRMLDPDVADQLGLDPLEKNPVAGVRIIAVNVGAATIERPVDRQRAGYNATARDRMRNRATRPDPRSRYFNLKAQISWELADRFADGEIDLDEDEDTQAQCAAIRYQVLSNGKLKIESKEELEERLKKMEGATADSGSPDRWDALVLCFADVETRAPVRVSAEMVERARTGRYLPMPSASATEPIQAPAGAFTISRAMLARARGRR
jgi:hypothetical protein